MVEAVLAPSDLSEAPRAHRGGAPIHAAAMSPASPIAAVTTSPVPLLPPRDELRRHDGLPTLPTKRLEWGDRRRLHSAGCVSAEFGVRVIWCSRTAAARLPRSSRSTFKRLARRDPRQPTLGSHLTPRRQLESCP